MRANLLELFVQGRLGDPAFLDVLDQTAVPAHKTDIEFLFRLVPLAANHDAIAITKRLRTGNHRRHQAGGKFPNPFK